MPGLIIHELFKDNKLMKEMPFAWGIKTGTKGLSVCEVFNNYLVTYLKTPSH